MGPGCFRQWSVFIFRCEGSMLSSTLLGSRLFKRGQHGCSDGWVGNIFVLLSIGCAVYVASVVLCKWINGVL